MPSNKWGLFPTRTQSNDVVHSPIPGLVSSASQRTHSLPVSTSEPSSPLTTTSNPFDDIHGAPDPRRSNNLSLLKRACTLCSKLPRHSLSSTIDGRPGQWTSTGVPLTPSERSQVPLVPCCDDKLTASNERCCGETARRADCPNYLRHLQDKELGKRWERAEHEAVAATAHRRVAEKEVKDLNRSGRVLSCATEHARQELARAIEKREYAEREAEWARVEERIAKEYVDDPGCKWMAGWWSFAGNEWNHAVETWKIVEMQWEGAVENARKSVKTCGHYAEESKGIAMLSDEGKERTITAEENQMQGKAKSDVKGKHPACNAQTVKDCIMHPQHRSSLRKALIRNSRRTRKISTVSSSAGAQLMSTNDHPEGTGRNDYQILHGAASTIEDEKGTSPFADDHEDTSTIFSFPNPSDSHKDNDSNKDDDDDSEALPLHSGLPSRPPARPRRSVCLRTLDSMTKCLFDRRKLSVKEASERSDAELRDKGKEKEKDVEDKYSDKYSAWRDNEEEV